MYKKHYKLSLFIIFLWMACGLYTYFTEDEEVYTSLKTSLFFISSCIIAIACAVIMITLRFITSVKSRDMIYHSFLYYFAGVFNFVVFITALICALLEVVILDVMFYALINLLLSLVIIKDIYRNKA